MTTATKCISVSTPFGTMYLKKDEDYDTYHCSDDDLKTKYIIDKLCTSGLHIVPEGAEWVAVYSSADLELVSYLPVASHYGNAFP